MENTVNALLALGRKLGASDLHLCVGASPAYRINGRIVRQGEALLSAAELQELAAQALHAGVEPAEAGADKRIGSTCGGGAERCSRRELDFAYTDGDGGRCRVNLYHEGGQLALAIRLLADHIPSCEELQLPPAIENLAKLEKGLVLVTGPTGSGKSSTLAALINKINTERKVHIITLEDPIEYKHQHQASLVNQRELGRDVDSFASGLRAALREDPDVIMVGELRDAETISTALAAAETGHLVFATLHTNDAVSSVNRILDSQTDSLSQTRSQLADVLQAVVSQQLLPLRDGSGRVAAFEIMLAKPALRNLIREGRTHQIRSYIETGSSMGMQTMETSIARLKAFKRIS